MKNDYREDTCEGQESRAQICQLLREKEELDAILSSVTDIVWSRKAGDDYKLLYINPAATAVYGYSPEELINTPGVLFDQLHPDDRGKMKQEIEATIRDGCGQLDYRIYHRDGSLRYMRGNGVVKKDDEGRPVVISGISTDVTELRLTEQELRKKIAEIENIFESITDSFISLDKNYRFTYINKEAEQLYNIKREELLNRELWCVFPNAKKLRFHTELVKAMTEQVPCSFEEFSPTADIWVSVNVYPTDNGLAVYFRNITSERTYLQRIEQQNEVLNDIARTQSHEVRGPVARIIGLAELLNHTDASDPANSEIIQGIKTSALELDSIIKKVVSKTSALTK
ncbi:MAG: PAS domain S-box protein [Flavipsychrobacter sp.]|nr:PAS domain S-box protein [Flavipsychrobacter sp.]